MITIDNLHFLYQVFIIISIVLYALYIFIKLKDDKKRSILYLLIVIPLIIIVGKLFTVITTKNTNIISAGLSSSGGALSIILIRYIYSKIVKNNKYFTHSILFLPCMYGIAKLGCFFNGCCFGMPYEGPLAIYYPNIYWDSVFPVQLVESIIFLLIFLYFYKSKKDIRWLVIISALSKFLLEYLRFSHIGKIITVNQITSLIIIFITLIIILNKKEKVK